VPDDPLNLAEFRESCAKRGIQFHGEQRRNVRRFLSPFLSFASRGSHSARVYPTLPRNPDRRFPTYVHSERENRDRRAIPAPFLPSSVKLILGSFGSFDARNEQGPDKSPDSSTTRETKSQQRGETRVANAREEGRPLPAAALPLLSRLAARA